MVRRERRIKKHSINNRHSRGKIKVFQALVCIQFQDLEKVQMLILCVRRLICVIIKFGYKHYFNIEQWRPGKESPGPSVYFPNDGIPGNGKYFLSKFKNTGSGCLMNSKSRRFKVLSKNLRGFIQLERS